MWNCISTSTAELIASFYNDGRLGAVSFDKVDELSKDAIHELDGYLIEILYSEDIRVLMRCSCKGGCDCSADGNDHSYVTEDVKLRTVELEVSFKARFYSRMSCLLCNFFLKEDDRDEGRSILREWCDEKKGFYREYDADGEQVVDRYTDRWGTTEWLTTFVLERNDAEDVLLVEIFIGLCRYRGILSMRISNDFWRIGEVKHDDGKSSDEEDLVDDEESLQARMKELAVSVDQQNEKGKLRTEFMW